MFLLQKALSIPARDIDVFTGENRKSPLLAHNPASQTPAPLLDDGTCIAEAVAIMEYLEERHPAPVPIGSTAGEHAAASLHPDWRRTGVRGSKACPQNSQAGENHP